MVDTFFYRRLAGIMINDLAKGDIVISPLFVNGIGRLSAKLRGIEVSYDENELRISSPYDFTLMLGGESRRMPAGNHRICR